MFYDQKGFSCLPADILIEKTETTLDWQDTSLKFYLTPGHSEGGLCFSIEKHLFTGDTMMEEVEPVVKLPGGNKRKLDNSIEMLRELFEDDTVVFPGHGATFLLGILTGRQSK